MAHLVLYFGVFLAFSAFGLFLILIHEMGHFLAGSLCRLRLNRLRVGPLQFQRDLQSTPQSNFIWKWNWRWGQLRDGRILMFATNRSMQGIAWRYFVYTLGGPMANLSCTLLVVPFWEKVGSVAGTVKFFAFGSALMGLLNLIPFTKRGFTSDGRRLLNFLSSKQRRDADLFLITVPERFNEIRMLHAKGDIQNASDRAQALIRDAENLPSLPVYTPCIAMIAKWKKELLAAGWVLTG